MDLVLFFVFFLFAGFLTANVKDLFFTEIRSEKIWETHGSNPRDVTISFPKQQPRFWRPSIEINGDGVFKWMMMNSPNLYIGNGCLNHHLDHPFEKLVV